MPDTKSPIMDEEKAKKKKSDLRKKLDAGYILYSSKFIYKVEGLLGAGGFGDVYKVTHNKDRQRSYALKTELETNQKVKSRLKIETQIFEDIQSSRAPIDKSHFVNMIDKGRTPEFKFYVMDLVGQSLYDLPHGKQGQKHSSPTIMRIARQTLQAIEALHAVGYLHRDVKPANFAIGLPPNELKLFLLDFGIARKYLTDDTRRIRIPRKTVSFVGTVKYASRSCHFLREQSRKDDLESWIYMVFEYFNPGYLVWHREKTRADILDKKVKFMVKPKEMGIVYNAIKQKKLFEICVLIDKLTFTCTPDYAAIHRILDEFSKEESIDEKAMPDWIKVRPSQINNQKKKKKKVAERLEDDEHSEERNMLERRDKKRKAQADAKKIVEGKLAKLYLEMNPKLTKQEIKRMIRSRIRKDREDEKQRRRREERRRGTEDEESDEDDDDYSDRLDYSDEDPMPRKKSFTTRKGSRERTREGDDRSRGGTSRKKGGENRRRAKSSAGGSGTGLERLLSAKKRNSSKRKRDESSRMGDMRTAEIVDKSEEDDKKKRNKEKEGDTGTGPLQKKDKEDCPTAPQKKDKEDKEEGGSTPPTQSLPEMTCKSMEDDSK